MLPVSKTCRGFAHRIIREVRDEKARAILSILLMRREGLRYSGLYRLLSSKMCKDTFNKKLKELVELGLVVKEKDPKHRQAVIYKLNPEVLSKAGFFEEEIAYFLMILDEFAKDIAITHIVAGKNSEAASKMLITSLKRFAFDTYQVFLRTAKLFTMMHSEGIGREGLNILYMVYYTLIKTFLIEAIDYLINNLALLAGKISLKELEKESKEINKLLMKKLEEWKKKATVEDIGKAEEELRKLVEKGIIGEKFLKRIIEKRKIFLTSETPEEAYRKTLEYYVKEALTL